MSAPTQAGLAVPSIVVIGAGQAGGWAARTLRDEGFAGRIVLIGEETHPPHERPPLSKALLAGTVTPESAHLFPAGTLEERGIEWRGGTRVRTLDRHEKRIVLEDGETIAYDQAILCTGGRARTLPCEGSDLPGVFALRTIEQSLALGDALDTAKRLVIVGGGWIGLEVAATARAKNVEVTIVEAMQTLCARATPSIISEYLRQLHEGHGVRVVLGCGLDCIRRSDGRALSVVLNDGRTLEADAVLISVGLQPNDELARGSGIACDGGILVDDACRTSDPAIFAAGDVAVSPSTLLGRRLRMESWRNAQDQGIAAAKSALGAEVRYDPLPWFWSDQYDVNVQIFGFPAPSLRSVVRGDIGSGSFIALLLDEGVVKAAVGINAPRDFRIAQRLIERRTVVRDEDLRDTTIPLARL
jgi:3-phenylpropionate/trans-cinnamate dioxygenase ferredoxin reductase subunit